MSPGELDPRSLPLQELRALRADLQEQDDAISYVRRMAQARLDLVRAEMRHRAAGDDKNITGELPIILGAHLTGGQARPPRPAEGEGRRGDKGREKEKEKEKKKE